MFWDRFMEISLNRGSLSFLGRGGSRFFFPPLIAGLLVSLLSLPSPSMAAPLKLPYNRFFYFNFPHPPDVLAPLEAKFRRKITSLFKKSGQLPPKWDWNLKALSELFAARALRRRDSYLPQRAVDAARWLTGDTARQLYIFLGRFSSTKKLSFQLSRYFRRELFYTNPNRFALTAWPSGKKLIFSLVFARRGAILAPLPRVIFSGEPLVIRGKILEHFSNPTFIFAGERGKSVFKYSIKPDSSGNFQLYIPLKAINSPSLICQLSVSDPVRGPWISDEFYIFRGKSLKEIKTFLKKKNSSERKSLHSRAKKPPNWPYSPERAAFRLWNLVQSYRKRLNLNPLRRDPELDLLAAQYAAEMVQNRFFAHTSPISGDLSRRMASYRRKYSFASENIAVAETPEKAFSLLVRSPIHRANLVDPKFILSGVGAARNRRGELFFVQIFIR